MTAIGALRHMGRLKRHARRIFPLASMDALIILVAYTIVYSVRTTSTAGLNLNLAFFCYSVIITLLCLYITGGYHRIWAKTSGHDVTILLSAVTLSTLLIGIPDYLLMPRPFPLSVVLVGNLLALSGFVAVRYRSRLISGMSWRWRAIWHSEFPTQDIRVMIIGAGDSGQVTAWRLKHRSPNGQHYHLVGFIDDDFAKQGMYIEGAPVLGVRAEIPALVAKHRVDLIILAIHNISGPDFRDMLGYCEETPARIKLVPDVFAMINGQSGSPLLRDITPEDLLGRQAVGWNDAVDITPIRNKIVLVTGAAGSIGSELCRQLLTYDPVKLVMLDNNESGLHDLFIELKGTVPEGKLIPVLVDITDRKRLIRVFEKHAPQVIFHSAAYKHVPMLEEFPEESVRVNVGGTLQVSGLARDFQAERFVLISTDKAVNPSSIMGASKRICELLMHAISQQGKHNTLYTSVRFGNVLGSRGSVVPTFNRQIEAGGPVTVTDENMKRYFMTIPEAVNLVIHAACLTHGDDLFMLRMGEEVPIIELAERMIRMRGLRPHTDISIQFTGVRPGEKLHEELHEPEEGLRPTIHPDIVELINHRNGLRPIGFLDRINSLFREGLDSSRDALSQLMDVIALGSSDEIVRH